jgi:hypothetical protein
MKEYEVKESIEHTFLSAPVAKISRRRRVIGDVDRFSSATAEGDRGGTVKLLASSFLSRDLTGINLLGHLLLLLLPLASLQIEERIDLLLFRLRIVKLQHIAGH